MERLWFSCSDTAKCSLNLLFPDMEAHSISQLVSRWHHDSSLCQWNGRKGVMFLSQAEVGRKVRVNVPFPLSASINRVYQHRSLNDGSGG